jgi:formylglycine-generating enzyme required for sulfatase activity
MLRSGNEVSRLFHGNAETGNMVWIPGGTFRMGSNDHHAEEAPVHRVAVDGFRIDQTPVTNRQFKAFVNATGYVTTAQIVPNPKDYPGALPSMIYEGSLVFAPPSRVKNLSEWGQWWTFMKGANWRRPSPTRSGRARSFRPKPNGSSLRAAASMAKNSPGATRSCLAAAGCRESRPIKSSPME